MENPNCQERPRTRDYSVNENSLFGKIYKWFEDETKRLLARPEKKHEVFEDEGRSAEC